jgi:hypothetical protein
MIRKAARRQAAMPTDQMVGVIRAMVGSRRHNFGITYHETLIDILVHGQDITIPLGRLHPIPAEAAAEAATRVWTIGWPFHSRRKFDGFSLVATNAPRGRRRGPRSQRAD